MSSLRLRLLHARSGRAWAEHYFSVALVVLDRGNSCNSRVCGRL